MNSGLSPTGLPAYFAYASCHSVWLHPPMASWLLVRSLVLSAHVRCPAGLPRWSGNPPSGRLGLPVGLRSALAGSSHRLAVLSLRGPWVHELCYGLARLARPGRRPADRPDAPNNSAFSVVG